MSQARLEDMKVLAIPYSEYYDEYVHYVYEYDSEYDIIKLIEDLMNSNCIAFNVNRLEHQVEALTVNELRRVLK